MGRKEGGCCAPFPGAGAPSSVAWAEVYFRTKRRLHLSSHLATIDVGQKLGGGGCALFLGVAGSTSNTMSRSPVHPIGHSPPNFGPCLLWPNGRPSQLLVSTCCCLLSQATEDVSTLIVLCWFIGSMLSLPLIFCCVCSAAVCNCVGFKNTLLKIFSILEAMHEMQRVHCVGENITEYTLYSSTWEQTLTMLP